MLAKPNHSNKYLILSIYLVFFFPLLLFGYIFPLKTCDARTKRNQKKTYLFAQKKEGKSHTVEPQFFIANSKFTRNAVRTLRM